MLRTPSGDKFDVTVSGLTPFGMLTRRRNLYKKNRSGNKRFKRIQRQESVAIGVTLARHIRAGRCAPRAFRERRCSCRWSSQSVRWGGTETRQSSPNHGNASGIPPQGKRKQENLKKKNRRWELKKLWGQCQPGRTSHRLWRWRWVFRAHSPSGAWEHSFPCSSCDPSCSWDPCSSAPSWRRDSCSTANKRPRKDSGRLKRSTVASTLFQLPINIRY